MRLLLNTPDPPLFNKSVKPSILWNGLPSASALAAAAAARALIVDFGKSARPGKIHCLFRRSSDQHAVFTAKPTRLLLTTERKNETLTSRLAVIHRLHTGLPSSHFTLFVLQAKHPVLLLVYLFLLAAAAAIAAGDIDPGIYPPMIGVNEVCILLELGPTPIPESGYRPGELTEDCG